MRGFLISDACGEVNDIDCHGVLSARTPQEAAECTSVLRPAWQVAPRICVPNS